MPDTTPHAGCAIVTPSPSDSGTATHSDPVTHSEWYQSLDKDMKSAIRDLHQLRLLWNLTPILFVLLWVGAAWLVMNVPHWSVWIAGYIFMGVVLHGIGNFMHEGIHGNLFRNRRWDRWYGFLCGAPVLFPVTAYGVNHLLHHKYTRSKQDPDEMLNITPSRWLLSAFFYFWFVFGSLVYSFRVAYIAMIRGTREERLHVSTERLLITFAAVGLLWAAYWYGFMDVMIHCWIIPLLVAACLGNVRGWAEHQLTEGDHPLRQTRTVTSHPVYSFLNIHLNYHLEHHLFPGVPWYNLPKVHRLLQPEYEKTGASVYRSYFWFIWDACRIGVHGKTPDFARQPSP